MNTQHELQQAVNAIRRELNERVGQRDLLNARIMKLETNLRNLRGLLFKVKRTTFGERREQLAVGLTEAIRTIMRGAGRPVTASALLLLLRKKDFDLDRFKNPSAAVHNTLMRMHSSGELAFDDAKKAYRFADSFWQ